jgi:hypothetical protein
MSAQTKAWCLGLLVSINAMLVPSLLYSWQEIYTEFSYPIDFFLPVDRTLMRAKIILCVAAVSIPLTCFLYMRSERELSRALRILTMIVTLAAALVSIAFAWWKYVR